MYPRSKLTKAQLVLIDKDKPKNITLGDGSLKLDKLVFPFNPKDLKVSRKIDLSDSERPPKAQYATLQAEGKGLMDELSFSIWLDNTAPAMHHDETVASMFLPLSSAEQTVVSKPVKFMPIDDGARVSDAIAILYAWTMIIDPDDEKKRRPYLLRFDWGKMSFTGGLAELEVEYNLFDSDGTPLRAKIDLKLKGRMGKWAVEDLLNPLKSTKSKTGSFGE